MQAGAAMRSIEAMRAITVVPRRADTLGLDDVSEPPASDGPILVQTVAIGICGTDLEIARGDYGWAPPGRERLVLGHESLGRVLEAPAVGEVAKGDLVVGIVRRPDPVPCANCAAGQWDFCENGRYTERGIKERDGYGSERYRIEPRYAVRVDRTLGDLGVLLEPASVVAKAWDVTGRLGARTEWRPRVALVTGAGPIGLLAALMAVQRGLEVHVLDRVAEGPKPRLVRALGATYHTGDVHGAGPPPDVIMECTGVDSVVFGAMDAVRANGVVCLTGVSSGAHVMSSVNLGKLNRDVVLENNIIFGSVNANRRHYELGAAALARADRTWLDGVVTRRVPLHRWREAWERRLGDVKTVVEFT
jgi:threonine dehydrogenase-like Zn-dependent dehydrogenase